MGKLIHGTGYTVWSIYTVKLIYGGGIYKKTYKYRSDIYIEEQTYKKTYI